MYLASQVGKTLYNEGAVAIAGSHSGAPSYADDRATWRLIVVPVRYSYPLQLANNHRAGSFVFA